MLPNSLNIISLNIETDRHYDRLIPFLKERSLDVLLLQEVLEKDIPYFEQSLGMHGIFTPIRFIQRDAEPLKLGMLTLSRLPILKNYSTYYRGNSREIPLIKTGEHDKIARAILVTEINKGGVHYCLVNTHFTWSPNGQPTEAQLHDINILLQLLSEIPQFILCGDFNAPRGTIIFDTIAEKYKDNVPFDIITTIDKNHHKAGDLNFVVDSIFTTPKYRAESVEIMDNLSDHCAILAKVIRIRS